MRRIGVVTVARSDFGIYRPVLNEIQSRSGLQLEVYVTGMHLVREFGMTVTEVEEAGYPIIAKPEMIMGSDTPEGVSKAMGLGTIAFAQCFSSHCPDILLVLGDRFEMHAAAVAAIPFNIPIAHIHGGELSFGAIDEVFRHSISKASHIHFPTTQQYAERLMRMGENPSRIVLAGAPSLDNILHEPLPGRSDLEHLLKISLSDGAYLITLHPETRSSTASQEHMEILLDSLSGESRALIFTMPNADHGSRAMFEILNKFCETQKNALLVKNLRTKNYFALMRECTAMLGNSSSGIIESASFQLPVVNIGDRQKGRVRAHNVIDAPFQADEIKAAIRLASSDSFRASLDGLINPYGDGHASKRIVDHLEGLDLDQDLVVKHFYDGGNA